MTNDTSTLQVSDDVSIALEDMDDATFDRAFIKEWNGLGLQVSESHYYLCILTGRDDPLDEDYAFKNPGLSEEQLVELKSRTGSETLVQGDFIGKIFLKIHHSEKHKIESVLDTLIKMGYNFNLQCNTQPSFGPRRGDTMFAWWMKEVRLCESIQWALDNETSRYFLLKQQNNTRNFFDLWNWESHDSKKMCKKIRALANLSVQNELTDKDNYYKWERWNDYTSWKNKQNKKRKHED